MIIGVDIDQTIGTGYKGACFQESVAYYQSKGLTIPQTVRGYPELFQLPAVLRIHEVLPGAIAGVTTLAHYGSITYYTVRKHEDAQVEKEIHAMTKLWLAECGFPFSDQVVFCRSVMHKLVQFHEREKESTDRLLLIDDRWQQAAQALTHIAENEAYQYIAQVLRERLTLIAFGATSLPESTDGLRVVAFSDWSRIADLLPYVE